VFPAEDAGPHVRDTAKQFQIISLVGFHEVRFEVFTAVTMKNGVFWDDTPYGSYKNLQEPYGVTSQKTQFFRISLSLAVSIFVPRFNLGLLPSVSNSNCEIHSISNTQSVL
jgi:hypothetical protein